MGLHKGFAVCAAIIATVMVALASAGEPLPSEIKHALASRDYASAVPWLSQRSNGGDADAAFELAKLYRIGVGVDKDPARSAEYLRIAADAGIVEAQYLLAVHHDRSGNANDANRWYLAAANAGHVRARDRLDKKTTRRTINVFAAIQSDLQPPERLPRESVDVLDGAGRTPLIAAVHSDSSVWLARLIDSGAALDARDYTGNTALHYAIAQDSVDSVRLLLRSGASVNHANNGITALHIAVASERESIVKLLLDHGADPNAKNSDGWSPSNLALRSSNDRLKSLLNVNEGAGQSRAARFARVDGIDPHDRLLAAAQAGDLELVRLLVGTGHSVAVTDDVGFTPLAHAVANRHIDVAVYLLDHGADPDVALSGGRTLQHLAARNQAVKLLRLITGHTRIVDPLDDSSMTPLMWTARSGCTECARILVNAGASNIFRNARGETALTLALQSGHADTAIPILFTDTRLALNMIDDRGRSALWWASKVGFEAIVNALLDEGAGTTADVLGISPLHAAAEANHVGIVSRLLALVDIDEKTRAGNTPLLLAAVADSATVVVFLLEQGADEEAQNRVGDTALIAAVRARSYLSASLLIGKPSGAGSSRTKYQV